MMLVLQFFKEKGQNLIRDHETLAASTKKRMDLQGAEVSGLTT